MPRTRPSEISDGVSLSDKLGREIAAFVAEDGALNTLLLRDCVVDILAPDEHGIGAGGSQYNAFARSDKLRSPSAIGVSVGAIVAFVEREA